LWKFKKKNTGKKKKKQKQSVSLLLLTIYIKKNVKMARFACCLSRCRCFYASSINKNKRKKMWKLLENFEKFASEIDPRVNRRNQFINLCKRRFSYVRHWQVQLEFLQGRSLGDLSVPAYAASPAVSPRPPSRTSAMASPF